MANKAMEDLRQEFNIVGRNLLSEVKLDHKNLIAVDSVDTPAYRRAVITNIAFYLAKKNYSCVIVNFDNDDETFFNSLKIAVKTQAGILNKVNGGGSNINIVNNTSDANLYFIPRGDNSIVTVEDAINDKSIQTILKGLAQKHDFVLINFPNTADSVTAKALSHSITGIIFVINAKSKRKPFREKVQVMKEKKVEVLGTVFVS